MTKRAVLEATTRSNIHLEDFQLYCLCDSGCESMSAPRVSISTPLFGQPVDLAMVAQSTGYSKEMTFCSKNKNRFSTSFSLPRQNTERITNRPNRVNEIHWLSRIPLHLFFRFPQARVFYQKTKFHQNFIRRPTASEYSPKIVSSIIKTQSSPIKCSKFVA